VCWIWTFSSSGYRFSNRPAPDPNPPQKKISTNIFLQNFRSKLIFHKNFVSQKPEPLLWIRKFLLWNWIRLLKEFWTNIRIQLSTSFGIFLYYYSFTFQWFERSCRGLKKKYTVQLLSKETYIATRHKHLIVFKIIKLTFFGCVFSR
jgi:hypothetical protein